MIIGLSALLASACSTSSTTLPPTGASSTSSTTTVQPITIGDVPLVAISTSQRKMCREAANQGNTPVPCPELVPEPMPGSTYACMPGASDCGISQIQEADGNFVWTQSDFRVPSDYVGVPAPVPGYTGPPLGHFVVYAARHLNLSRLDGPAQPVPSYCTAVEGYAALKIHGSAATPYECSDTWNQSSIEIDVGHELLVWQQSGVTCEVSLHGHSLLNQELDVAIARATTLVRPK